MASEMVKRVAKIIEEGYLKDNRGETIACVVIAAMREPTEEMKRGLLKHRGYDPDAKEETLDRLGQLDIATMWTYIKAYQAMIDEALK